MNQMVFSAVPGSRERHLQRQYKNILFAQKNQHILPKQLESAQYLDQEEGLKFEKKLHSLITDIASMDSNVSSELILNYKEKLDIAYAQCCCLCADQLDNKKIIIQLINVLMKSVWQGAQGDEQAIRNLEEEEIAREQHLDLLQIPLIADLLAPHSQITEDQLIAVILSESEAHLADVMSIFTREQQQQIYQDSVNFLDNLKVIDKTHPAWDKLETIKNM